MEAVDLSNEFSAWHFNSPASFVKTAKITSLFSSSINSNRSLVIGLSFNVHVTFGFG